MPEIRLLVDGLVKRFGPVLAVDGISLRVAAGEVLGFLGPNGAGKSTTMKVIAGFLPADGGAVRVCGHDVASAPVAAKRHLGYLPEGAPAYGDMTPAGFLDFVAGVRGFDGAERRRRIAAAVERTALAEVVDRPIDTLSKGFRRRVGLAQAILHDPPVLILDEPTDGLDPNQKRQVRRLIADMAADKAIVVSTHILDEVEAVCTRAVIIGEGRLLVDGTPDDLLARSRTRHAVALRLEPAALDSLRGDLAALDAVAGLEEPGDGRLIVLARPGRRPAEAVAGLLRARGLDTAEFSVERGSLDEVFRRVTRDLHEDESAHA